LGLGEQLGRLEVVRVERSYIEPAGMYKHPAFTSILTVTDPHKWHFFAGRCSVDENYKCIGPGDFGVQYRRVMEILDNELATVGASWNASAEDPVIQSYWDPERMPPSTLIGVTRLSDPDFLIEIDLMAITN
jgi:enamine deaminase RidA (YjgF/YER057c/UK114 family)